MKKENVCWIFIKFSKCLFKQKNICLFANKNKFIWQFNLSTVFSHDAAPFHRGTGSSLFLFFACNYIKINNIIYYPFSHSNNNVRYGCYLSFFSAIRSHNSRIIYENKQIFLCFWYIVPLLYPAGFITFYKHKLICCVSVCSLSLLNNCTRAKFQMKNKKKIFSPSIHQHLTTYLNICYKHAYKQNIDIQHWLLRFTVY